MIAFAIFLLIGLDMNIFSAISLGGLSLFSGPILVSLFFPWVVSFVVFSLFFWFFGSSSAVLLQNAFLSFEWARSVESWVKGVELLQNFSLASLLGYFLLFVLMLPVFYLLSLLITSLFMVPWIGRNIRKRNFPQIRSSGAFSAKILWVTVKSSFWYLIFWTLTLPLFFIPIVGLLIPILLNAWITFRLLPIEVLTEISDFESAKKFTDKNSFKLFLMALVFSSLMLIPFAFLFVPFWATASFCFYLYENYTVIPKTSSVDRPSF